MSPSDPRMTRPALARAYGAHGWPVLPLHSPGTGGCDCRRPCNSPAKHPRTRNGLQDASADVDVIEQWWSMWPNANIGIATGRTSGLVVLDVDFRTGGDQSLAALTAKHGGLPETPCVATGNGLHYYFEHPGEQVRCSAGRIGPGLDLRGDGGYVVAPPSVHASGKPYTWLVACDPVPMPAWLTTHELPTLRPVADTPDILSGVVEGERDVELFRLACKLRRADVPRDVAEELVLRAAAACVPPFAAPDALKKVASAYDRYPATAVEAPVTRRLRNVR